MNKIMYPILKKDREYFTNEVEHILYFYTKRQDNQR
jgi:hypothetical protein